MCEDTALSRNALDLWGAFHDGHNITPDGVWASIRGSGGEAARACRMFFERMLRAIPAIFAYGKLICADGREVLFNWSYQPIWQRSGPGKTATEADPE
jgi:hypothetical protein